MLQFILPPIGKGWWTGIELLHLFEMMEKIKKQGVNLGNARKWQTVSVHWLCYHWRKSIGLKACQKGCKK